LKTITAKIRGEKVWPYIFTLPFIILYFTFNIYPIMFSLYTSFTSWDGIGTMTFVGLKNYSRLLTKDPYFFKSIWNTIVIMLEALPLCIILGLLLAVFLFSLKKWKRVFQTVNFLPYVTTPVAIGLIFALQFDWTTGVINKVLLSAGLIHTEINWLGNPQLARVVVALMVIWKNIGYIMVIYLSGLSTVPAELYEAAKVDGASAVQNFFKITIPMIRPITVFIVITSLIGGLQMFDEPSLLFTGTVSGASAAGGPDRSCLTAVWNFYDVTFKSTTQFGYGSAIAYSIFMIIIIFSVINFIILNRGDEE